jgi:hypothetical protein
MNDRQIASGIAAGRLGFGAFCMAMPRLVLGSGGSEASGTAVWMVRAFGTRDMTLGAGTLMALAEGGEAKRWVMAGAAADTVDAITAVAFRKELGPPVMLATLALAVPAAVLGWKAALGLDSPS